MDLKRVLTTVVGIPAILIVFIFGNKYVIDVIVAIVAIMALYEYSNCIKHESKSFMWLGYVISVGIAFLHIFPRDVYIVLTIIGLPTIVLIMFMHIIVTNMKINFKDIAYSSFGIMYICIFTLFIAVLYGYNNQTPNEAYNYAKDGKFLIWYLFIASWGTDIFAYLVGSKFGKHKFSKISPKKSIEGCVGGTLGSCVSAVLYTFVLSQFGIVMFDYITVFIFTAVLSIIGQIGDFSASTIKRYFEVKDFSNLIPGHGGILDRIDSVLFMAPYAYLIFTYIL